MKNTLVQKLEQESSGFTLTDLRNLGELKVLRIVEGRCGELSLSFHKDEHDKEEPEYEISIEPKKGYLFKKMFA